MKEYFTLIKLHWRQINILVIGYGRREAPINVCGEGPSRLGNIELLLNLRILDKQVNIDSSFSQVSTP